MIIHCYDESTTQKEIISLESHLIKEIDIKYRVIKEDVRELVDFLERKRTCKDCKNETSREDLPCNLCARHMLGDFYEKENKNE